MTAEKVTVEPVTLSTFRVWFSTMSGSVCFSMGSTMPGISEFSPISMLAILPPSTVTVTSTGACLPRAEAV